MPNADLFYQHIQTDNRAYLVYDVVDPTDGKKLEVGTQVRVLAVNDDEEFSSGSYALCRVTKNREIKIDVSYLMDRRDWEKLVKAIHNRALTLVLRSPARHKDEEKSGK